MPNYTFPCGCSFPVLDSAGSMPLIDFDIENIPESCPSVWALLAKGLTKGVFQLESPLGRQWVREQKPTCIEHLTALGALLRPGCLNSRADDGTSMTKVYCERKNGERPIDSIHPAVDPILEDTYNVLTYQEQMIAIGVAVAGFSLQEADTLRKSAAKKIPELMAKCEKMFLDGVEKTKVINMELGKQLWEWIKKSQRYLFNRSHSRAYGVIAYQSAYIKAHFPQAFYAGWLRNAHLKQDSQEEIKELINETKLLDVSVKPPDVRGLQAHFYVEDNHIRFGISSIKGIGDAQVNKLAETVPNLPKDTWGNFLLSQSINANVMTGLICGGALDFFKTPRTRMLAEYKAWNQLTEKEQEWLKTNGSGTVTEAFKALAKPKKAGGGAANKNRIATILSHVQLLENPPTPLEDSSLWLAWAEEKYLGITITCSRTDGKDLAEATATCKEIASGRKGFAVLGVAIKSVRETKTKSGKTPGAAMAYLEVLDSSCSLGDVVCFPQEWEEYNNKLTEGNFVLMQGELNNRGSFVIKHVKELNER